jgi:hypothetical protein
MATRGCNCMTEAEKMLLSDKRLREHRPRRSVVSVDDTGVYQGDIIISLSYFCLRCGLMCLLLFLFLLFPVLLLYSRSAAANAR